MTRTVSLRPDLPKDRFLPMLEACVEIFDIHTKWATENRTWSKQKAHDALYRSIRESCPEIPSAILQTTRDCALEAVKRCNNKGEWHTPTKNTLSARYNLRTISARGNLLTLSCIGRRFRIMLDNHGYEPQRKLQSKSQTTDTMILRIHEHFHDVVKNWKLKAATLKYDKRDGFRLNLNYETQSPPKIKGRGLGIDIGLKNFAVTSDGEKHPGLRAAKRREAALRPQETHIAGKRHPIRQKAFARRVGQGNAVQPRCVSCGQQENRRDDRGGHICTRGFAWDQEQKGEVDGSTATSMVGRFTSSNPA